MFLAMFGTVPLSKWAGNRRNPLEVGDSVLVRKKSSPLAGQSGRVEEITLQDPYGPYLVQFDTGFRFRYRRNELVLTCNTDSARQAS